MTADGSVTATQQTITINAGDKLETTMKAGETLVLAANGADVQGMTMDSAGALHIQFSDGATLTVKNFAEVATAEGSGLITLPSGQTIQLAELIQTLTPAANDSTQIAGEEPPVHSIVIEKPHAHENVVVKLHAGDHYKFDFAMTDPASVKSQHGQLVIAFKDGGTIIIPNYGEVKSDGSTEIAMKDGSHMSVSDMADTLAQAAQLNQIEPAAGNSGGAHGGGFGFNSVFEAQNFSGLKPIGPIDPTALQYGTFDRYEEGFAPEATHAPSLTVSDVWVKEDGSVALDIHAHLVAPHAGDYLTVTVTGFLPGWTVDTSVSGGTYDSATGTWTLTLAPGTDFDGGPTVFPPANTDGDMPNLQVSAVTTGTAGAATSTGVENVFTDAVVDPVTVTAHNATGDEGTSIPLSISIGASADTDGSEHVTKVVISGVPADATLNHGTLQSDGTWLLTPADLSGLTITPEAHFNGDIGLTVTVTEQETNLSGAENDYTDNTADTTTQLSVHVNDIIAEPSVSANDVWVKEDGGIALDIHANLNNPGPADHLTITVTGFLPGWTVDTSASGGTYDSASGTWTIDLAPGASFDGGPTVYPPANSDADMTGLSVTATASDGIVSASANAGENVFTDAVVDPVTVSASDASGNEGSSIPLSISIGASADTDGSEHVTKVVISGVPADATLNHGTLQLDGTWLLTQADLSGLTITPAAHFNGDFSLSVAVTEQETNLSGAENDYTDNTAVTTTELNVHVENIINAPDLKAGNVWVKEDGHVALDIHAHLNDPGPADQLTVTVTGFLPGWTVDTSSSGGTYDSTTGTWTITLAPGASFDGGPEVYPPANSDADMPGLTVTATVSDGSISASATVGESVFTDAVVDPVTVTAHDAAGTEGATIPLSISIGASADTDGSEHVTKVVISGVPADATLNHGTLQLDGTWLLTQADLSGLTITPSAHFSGDIPLSVAVTEQETNLSGLENTTIDNTAVTTTTLNVHIEDTINQPNLEIHDVWTKEDGGVALDIHASLNDPGPHDHLVITVSGIQAGWTVDTSVSGGTYDSTTGTWTITLPDGASFAGGPIVHPPANSDADMTGLTVTAVATDGAVSATTTGGENVFTDAVVDPVTVTAHNASGDEGTSIPLSISIGASADTDGSEHVTKVVISGVPADASLNHGALQLDGTWLLSPSDLTGLTITAAPHFSGDITLSVAVTEQETNLSGAENDLTDNTAVTTASLNVHIGDTITPPTVSANDVWVKEDGGVQLDVHASLNNPGPTDHLVVTISGIQAGWTVDTSVSGGTYNSATGTWTITLPDGVNFAGGPVVHPPANSDADMTGLVVTATATDGTVSASSTAGENVFTDAVVDPIGITAHDATGSDNGPISLSISVTDSADHDGSEHVTKVVISGVPAGATLNHGTLQLDGTWLLTEADLTGLTITPVRGADANFTLTATATEQETNLSGLENDLSDNTTTATTTLQVHVHDDTPILVSTPDKTVDETNLSGGNITVSGNVTANYYTDTPGAVSATGAGSFSASGSLLGGHLTSDGYAVTVTESGGTYIGTANGHEVFEFTIGADGHFSFTLEGTLDHADAGNPNDVIDLHFGVTATDADGDTATGSVTVHVLDDAPTAHDDHNVFDAGLGHTDGNVISGLHGGAGAADSLSQDTPDLVTQVSFGSHVVNVPTSGTATIDGDHGELVISADGSYTYTLFTGSGAGGGSTTVDTQRVFTGNAFPTDLLDPSHESVPINTAQQADLGELHSNLAMNTNTGISGQITFDGAGYTNSLGAFTIAADGTLLSAQMIVTSITGTGATFSAAADGAAELGFFLVANGYNTNSAYAGLDFSTGHLNFVYDYGQGDARAANVSDDGNHVSLVFTDASGHDTVISGPIYYTTDRGGDNSLNPDGVVHTLSGVNTAADPSGHTLTIAFEDLPNGGDLDYNDAIFNVQLTDHTTVTTNTTDQFHYTLTDGDGDNSTALLTFDGIAPAFYVGTNVDDNHGSTTTWEVGGGHDTISGGGASDILVGDVGGATMVDQHKDYNIELVLDVSGSMAGTKLALLKSAVDNLLASFNDYHGGEVKVHIVTFSTTVQQEATFDVSDATGYANALAFVGGLSANGYTNYEDPLQHAITWLGSTGANAPIAGATDFTYFVSDGEPNTYVSGTNHSAGNGSASATTVMNEILGISDGTNEVGTLQGYGHVTAVGIGVDSTTLGRLDQIDSNGDALDVQHASDLSAALQGASPLNQIAAVGGDHIVGGDGNDLIFGDALNTDVLAAAHHLSLPAGSGFSVFEALEAGGGWTRADTIAYIQTHASELAVESHGSDGSGRTGGNDTLEGGAGNDTIFGQEGNDWIDGGTGNNVLSGGSGADTFHISNSAGTGVDHITDFSTAQGDKLDLSAVLAGYDPLTSALHNFVSVSNSGADTIVQIDASGSGHAFTTVAVVEGVHLDLDAIFASGNLIA